MGRAAQIKIITAFAYFPDGAIRLDRHRHTQRTDQTQPDQQASIQHNQLPGIQHSDKLKQTHNRKEPATQKKKVLSEHLLTAKT